MDSSARGVFRVRTSLSRCRDGREVLALNDNNNWRRVESASIEQLVERVLLWIVVLVLLGVIAYCAVTAKPAYATGGMLLLLSGLVRGRRAS